MSDTYAPEATPAPVAAPEPETSGIDREIPQPEAERQALVTRLLKDVKADKKKWKPSLDRMRADMKFVRRQLPNEQDADERPKVNIVQRHVKNRAASLYAKDPTFVAKRRKRMDFVVWDGKRASLEAAAQDIAQSQQMGAPPAPETIALMKDVQDALQRRQMLDNVGKTLEILLAHALTEQQPPFKPQCKQLVRRAVICTVGYTKIMYQRQLAKRPPDEAKLADITEQLATYERLAADVADGEVDPNSAEVEELKLIKAAMDAKAQEDVVIREGLVYDFTSPLRVIPDRDCTLLAPGFPGARRVTEEILMSCDDIQEVYGKDVKSAYTGYTEVTEGETKKSKAEDARGLVYEIYDRRAGLMYVVCDGYPDFLQEPAPPPLPYLETFFPFIPLVFNALEEEGEIYPESDIRLLRPIQREINRKVESIRTHRIANRPLYGAKKGVLNPDDAKSLSGHSAHDVIEFESLEDGVDIAKVFQPFPKIGVDPNLYETGTDLTLMTLIVGTQESSMGKTNGDSATSSAIAENSRVSSVGSETDDLDAFLSTLARLSGQVLLKEMTIETVKATAGPGAVWPELTAQEIAEEVTLQIEAGSSGRPNRERDLANVERAAPFLLQTPGMNPEWFLKMLLKLMDDTIDYEEAITAGLPSITTMNRQPQPGTGDPATDPAQQGQAGAANAPNDDTSTGGPQAAQPAPSTEQPNTIS